MPKRKNKKPPQESGKRPSLRALYAKLRAEFTAADLQRYTEIEEGIPVEHVIAEMENIHRQETQRRRKA